MHEVAAAYLATLAVRYWSARAVAVVDHARVHGDAGADDVVLEADRRQRLATSTRQRQVYAATAHELFLADIWQSRKASFATP